MRMDWNFCRCGRGLSRLRLPCGACGFQAFDFYAGNSAAFDFHYGEAVAVVFETFAAARQKSEVGEHEAGERFVRGIFGELDVKFVEVMNFERGVENHGAVDESERAFNDVELIVNFADHLFENVFEGDEAENGAEFVDDHGEAAAMRAEFDEKFDGGLGFGNDEDFAKHVAKLKFDGRLVLFGFARAIEQDPEQIFDVHEAENMIDGSFVNRNARALRDGDDFHDVFERGVGGQRVNVGARDHDFANLHVAEIHRAVNEFFLGGLKDAAFAGLFDKNAQFFGGTNRGVRARSFHAEDFDEAA